MPTIRIFADGRSYPATPAHQDRYGILVFKVAGGSTIKLTIDYTAFLGDATISSGAWTINGATQGDATESGATVTTLIAMQSLYLSGSEPSTYSGDLNTGASAVHRMTASDGRIINVPVQFWVQPATGTDLFILDGSYLA